MSRSRVSIIIIVLLTHAAIWAYPVAPGGLGNLSAFLAWIVLIILAIGALGEVLNGPSRSAWVLPRWFTLASRISFWSGLVWLVYHGIFLLSAALLAITVMHWAASRASDELDRELRS